MKRFLRYVYSDPLYVEKASLLYLKITALTAGLIYPAYCGILIFIDPFSEHAFVQRSLIGLFGVTAYLMLWSGRFKRMTAIWVMCFGAWGIVAHMMYLCHVNQLSFIYAIGTFLAYSLIAFWMPTLQGSLITLIIGVVGAATLVGKDYGVSTSMYFWVYVVASSMIYTLRLHLYRLTMDLIYTNEVKSMLTHLLQAMIDSKDLAATLNSTMEEFANISWCKPDVPLALFVQDPDSKDWVYERKHLCEKLERHEFKGQDFEWFQLGTSSKTYGFLFIGRKSADIPEDLKSQLLSSIANSLTLVMDNHFKNEKFEKQRTLLVHSAKMISLGEMAGGIAHEINTPLAAINVDIANLGTLKEMKLVETEEFDLIIKKIGNTVTRMAQIISGLRTFARDGTRDDLEQLSVESLVEDAANLCHEKFKHNDVRFEFPKGISMHVKCQRVQVNQVLLNLLSNAYDVVAKLDESRRWVRVDVTEVGAKVQIKVFDGGTGVPPEIATKIFQPFFTTKEVGKGTGLGLSISKGLIESQGGRLYLDGESKETCFVIELQSSQDSAVSAA